MKKWICRILIFLSIIAISIVISNAVAENGLTEGEFARYAINNRSDFFDDEWLGQVGNYQLIPAGGAIYNVSAVCLFHTQSNIIGGDTYSVLRYIIDINGSTIKLNGVELNNKNRINVLKLAYILNYTYTGTDGAPGSPNKELMKNLFHALFPDASELSGFARQGGINSGNSDIAGYVNLENAANEYAQKNNIIVEPTKMQTVNDPSIHTEGKKSYLGPFKAKFEGYPVESIKLSVNGGNSELIDKVYIKDNEEYKETTTLPSNKAFYLLLDDSSITRYKLKVKFVRSVHKARMMLFGNEWNTGQNIGIYATALGLGDSEDEDLELEWIDNLSGKLKIIKRDIDTNKKISGVKIRVTGPNNYEKEFTMKDASKTLSGLTPGKYKIEEIDAPPGYKLDYQVDSVEVNTVEEAEITAGETTSVTMYNRKYTDLIILKGVKGTNHTVTDITDQKMSDVVFKIYIEENGEKKYIGKNCNIPTERDDNTVVDDLKLTTDINKAKEFRTNSKGEIRLYNIPVNKYYIKEIKLPEDKSQYYNMAEDKVISTYTDSNNFEYYLKRVTKNLYENSTAKSVTKDWNKDKFVKSLYRSITGTELKDNTIINRLKTLLEDKDSDGNYTVNGINEVIDEIFDKYLTKERIESIKTNVDTKKAYMDYILGKEQLNISLRVLTYDTYFYRLNKYTVIAVDNEIKVGNLKIEKSDYDTKEALKGAQFNITNNLDPSDIRYVNKDVTTNEEGIIELKNLPIGKYTITEIKAPDGYKLTLQKVEQEVNVKEDKVATVSYINRKYGDLIVEKIDQDKKQDSTWSEEELHKLEELIFKGAKFKIYYTTENDSTPRYITNFVNNTELPSTFGETTNENDDEVTIFTTDENAKFELNNIPLYYIYHIKEVELPDEMAQYYEVKSDVLDVKLENNADENKTDIKFENKQERVDIEGFVWEDIGSGKETVRDDVYDISASDAQDKLISNIPVHLYKNGIHIATRYTDDNGKYFFPAKSKFNSDTEGNEYTIDLFYYENNQIVGVTGAGLQQYHIEFEYNGLKYQSVLSAWNMEEDRRNDTWEINSKADEKEELRESINNNFSTILENGSRDGSEGQTKGKTSTGIDLTYDTQKIMEDDVTYYESYLVNRTDYTSNSLNGYVNPVNSATMFAKTPSADRNMDNAQNNGSPLKWKSGLRTIKNINLGMYERRQPDMYIATDVDNIEFNINGYSHIYDYKKRIDEVLPELPDLSDLSNNGAYEAIMNDFSIKAKSKYTGNYRTLTYNRYIYDSYIAYTEKNKENDNRLRLFVTYKITVINEGSRLISKVGLRNFADDNLNFVNSYYKYRYKENGIVEEKNGEEIIWKKDEGNNYWETDGLIDYNISQGYSMDVYLTYELDKEKIISLVQEKEMTLDSNVTEIKEYQTLDEQGNPYGGIDRDSAPGNIIYENLDTYEDDTDVAPDIKFTRKDSKQISGLVFEDNPLDIEKDRLNTNRERKGNGQFDDGENKIKNVKVELMKYPESDNDEESIGELYFITDDGKTKIEKAFDITDDNGEYHFSGLIPGQYYIRYTYGDYDSDEDSHTIIIDPSGKQVNKVTTQNYKSTVVNTELYKQLIENNIENLDGKAQMQLDFENKKSETALWYWYQNTRDNDSGNQSSAVDNKEIRSKINESLSEINYYTKTDYENKKLEELHKMEAYTGIMDVSVEDYQGQRTGISYDELMANRSRDYKIKFGIIERPRQSLQVNKEISEVSLILANGQVLTQGDPRNGNINYVTYPEFGPTKIEVDNEIIEGSTLGITYEIRIDNRSEVDYDDVNYYRYGDNNNKDVVKIKLDTIIDYLDEKLSVTYDIDKQDSQFEYYKDDTFNIDANSTSKWMLISEGLNSNSKIAKNIDSDVYNSIKKRSNIVVKNLGQEIEPDNFVKLNLTAKKLLSDLNDQDQIFNNYVELIHLSNSVGRFYGETVTNQGWKLATPGNFNVTKVQDGNANDECDNSYYDRYAKYSRGDIWGDNIDIVPMPPPIVVPPPNIRDAQLVILPPTGGDNFVGYYILGLGCLIVLSGGVLMIKKVVLD